MKNFLLELVTNRFGIVLATINVCAMARKIVTGPLRPSQDIVASANFPAIDVGIPTTVFIKDLCGFRFSTAHACDYAVMTIVVVAQWLLIAYFAKHAAAFISQAMAAKRS